ncbi:unnamed protein product [Rotaria sordida]|uniref:Fork-head domain-containing protein n=1 Tax=Rotaria sordida TaxID=392033 RepID=A0A818RAG7_9BILA|nr:unnamed protein product [Rotaria sordida]
MANEEDECDSSSLFTVASQSDVTAFLHAQAAKITGLNSSVSDDDDDDGDESSIVVSSLSRYTQISSKNLNSHKKPYLSHSCFASISNLSSSSSSPQKQTISDDLTELKWLNTFKFKELKDNKNNNVKNKIFQHINSNNDDEISKLCNELKTYDYENLNRNSISFGVLIFLALYSKRYDKQTPWLLTIKQLYEYIQINIKQVTTKRRWKDLLKQTLINISCFIKTKRDILKSRSVWTIDPYYRPLLTRAYLTRLSLQTNKTISANQNEKKQIFLDKNHFSKSIINNFAPKSTVKTKVLPRLYERLCEEKTDYDLEDETDSNNIIKLPYNSISGLKRPRSISLFSHRQPVKDNHEKCRLSSSETWITKSTKRNKIHSNIKSKLSTSNRESTIITPCPSVDHTYLNPIEQQNNSIIKRIKSTEYNEPSSIDEDDERDSNSLINSIHKSTITTRSQISTKKPIHNTIKKKFVQHRKSSSSKKRLSHILPLNRPNTRRNRKIIEQDLELLRQANNNLQLRDLSTIPSNQSIKRHCIMSDEINSSDIQLADLHSSFQSTLATPNNLYHNSVCGSILYCSPTNSSSQIFSYLLHGKFDVFRRSLDIYHKDIILMKNEHEQTVLHILTMHNYPYQWIRLLMMFRCDPCCQDIDGYTAAHYAVERDDAEMLKALTMLIHSQIKIFSEEQTNAIHERCLKALSIREKQGLTVFMLACHHESIKCLDYLLELNINDVNLQDNFGDTCLHYAVARRNENLVMKLLNQCNANINGGDNTRPSVLDVLQYNREQRKPFDRAQDDSIKQILLSHNALNRCQVRRIVKKRKHSCDNDESVKSNLTSRTDNESTNSQIETARNYARTALSLQNQSKFNDAEEYYKRAMNSIPNDILDWTDYAFNLALIHIIHGENQSALDLLQQALKVRQQFENETEDIEKIQRAINNIQIT